jgi:virginiamycin B lyase
MQRSFLSLSGRFVAFTLFFLGIGWLGTSPVAAQTEVISTTFVLRHEISGTALNLVAEAPGRLWFTLPAENMIGSLVVSSTTTNTIQYYPVPTANSEPYDLAYADGVIWFTERLGNKLGRLEISTGEIEEFSIPTVFYVNYLPLVGVDQAEPPIEAVEPPTTPASIAASIGITSSEPTGIAVARDGTVWFASRKSNQIGRFDPATKEFVEYRYDRPGGQFEHLTISPNGLVWVTAPEINRVVSFNPVTERFVDIFTGTGTRPMHIVTDSNNTPWVTMSDANRIGRYTPGTLALWRWYDLPTPDSAPVGLAIQEHESSLTFWFAGNLGNQLGRLTTRWSGLPLTVLEKPLPTQPLSLWDVEVDMNGHVWAVAQAESAIYEWQPPYFYTTHMPMVHSQSALFAR